MVKLSNFKNPRWQYIRTAVARNTCVSWAFLLLLPANCVFKLTSNASSTVNCGNWHVFNTFKITGRDPHFNHAFKQAM